MDSGIRLQNGIAEMFKDMNKLKCHHNCMLLKVNDEHTQVDICKEPYNVKSFSEFVEDLTTGDCCRYGIYKTPLEWGTQKLTMAMWACDDYPLREKMLYSASSNNITRQLAPIESRCFQANNIDELNEEDYKHFFKITPLVTGAKHQGHKGGAKHQDHKGGAKHQDHKGGAKHQDLDDKVSNVVKHIVPNMEGAKHHDHDDEDKV